MARDRFVYVTYIRTTPEKLWEALFKPEFTRQYWFGVTLESDWKAGSPWKMVLPDGSVAHDGEVLDIEPEKRVVFRWRGERTPEMRAEGYSRCAMEIEEVPSGVKLTVLHEIERAESKLIEDVSGGWPMILSNLKSMLETGNPLADLPATCRPAA